ncbi:hypothetical protein C8Q79DRAFT_238893 [Trametes meyenii]|nr:hypothetical protein C8Q79DRAFT_238893 [Trametes meyenii]
MRLSALSSAETSEPPHPRAPSTPVSSTPTALFLAQQTPTQSLVAPSQATPRIPTIDASTLAMPQALMRTLAEPSDSQRQSSEIPIPHQPGVVPRPFPPDYNFNLTIRSCSSTLVSSAAPPVTSKFTSKLHRHTPSVLAYPTSPKLAAGHSGGPIAPSMTYHNEDPTSTAAPTWPTSTTRGSPGQYPCAIP